MSPPPTKSQGARHLSGSWFERHPRKALALITLTTLTASVVALELGARLLLADWGPTIGGERTTFAEYDAELGWAHRRGFEALFSRREFSTHVRISPDGLRDASYPLDRTDAQRLLVLGDSFGWGYGIEREDRFDEILELRHGNWEIINASVSGYGTDQQLIYLRTRGLAYRPDVVLLLLYRNDFANNSAAVQYYTNKPYFVLQDNQLKLQNTPVPRPYLTQRVARWIGGTYLIGRAMQGAIRLTRSFYGNDLKSRSQGPTETSFLLTRRIVDEIHTVSRSIGADFVLVSVPMDAAPRDALAEQARQSGFSYLPLDKAFQIGGAGLVLPNDGHWNERGHEVAANAIEDFLLEQDLMTTAVR